MLLLKGHKGKIGSNAITYSPDGRLLATGAEDGWVIVWEIATGKPLFTIKRHKRLVTGVGFLRGGATLVTASWDATVRFWDVATRKQARRFGTTTYNCLAVSRDGLQVAAAGGRYWTTLESIQRWGLADAAGAGFRKLPEIGQHANQIGALAFSPDGHWLASGSADRTTRLWELATGEPGHAFRSRAWIQGLAFSPDWRILAVAAGRHVTLHSTDSGEEMATLTSHKRQALSVAFTPSGRTLISGSKDGMVCCWDVATGRPGAAYRWKIGTVEAVAVAPDGMTAAAGGQGDVVVWDLDVD